MAGGRGQPLLTPATDRETEAQRGDLSPDTARHPHASVPPCPPPPPSQEARAATPQHFQRRPAPTARLLALSLVPGFTWTPQVRTTGPVFYGGETEAQSGGLTPSNSHTL